MLSTSPGRQLPRGSVKAVLCLPGPYHLRTAAASLHEGELGRWQPPMASSRWMKSVLSAVPWEQQECLMLLLFLCSPLHNPQGSERGWFSFPCVELFLCGLRAKSFKVFWKIQFKYESCCLSLDMDQRQGVGLFSSTDKFFISQGEGLAGGMWVTCIGYECRGVRSMFFKLCLEPQNLNVNSRWKW